MAPFSVFVHPAEATAEHDVFLLEDGATYSVEIRNGGAKHADATLFIDGVDSGTFRVKASSLITVRRPAKADKSFIFVADTSVRAATAGVVAGDSMNGRVKVLFRVSRDHPIPALEERLVFKSCDVSSAGGQAKGGVIPHFRRMDESVVSGLRSEAGATILGAASGQTLVDASSIQPYSEADTTVIELHLRVKVHEIAMRVYKVKEF